MSRREPEKTPLIDIIFILLIFFLVTISTNLGRGSSGEGKGEENCRIPVIRDPIDTGGEYLLIDVVDLSDGPAMKIDMTEDLRGAFMDLSGRLDMDINFRPVPRRGFMVSVLGGKVYSDLSAYKEVSMRLLNGLERGASPDRIRERARELFALYPEFLPSDPSALTGEAEARMESMIDLIRGLAENGEEMKVHIRMPEDMYMHFVKSAFSILERTGVDIDRIRIHAMKE